MYDFKSNFLDENDLIINSEMNLKEKKSSLLIEKKDLEKEIDQLDSQIKGLKKQELNPDESNLQKKLVGNMMNLSNKIEEVKEKIKDINKELAEIKEQKSGIKDLENFSKKLTNLTLIDHIDGNLSQTESDFVHKLSELNNEMKEDLDSMMLANSFYGRVNNEVTQLDPAILNKWKSHEKKTLQPNPAINIYKWLSDLSPIKLITGSAISGAAIASISMLSFTSINTYSVLRSGSENINQLSTKSADIQINQNKIPTQWIIQNGLLFSIKINNENFYDLKDKVIVKDGDNWNFLIVPSKDMILNIQYVDENSKSILAKDLKLEKGQTYFSKAYKFSPPLVDGRLIISENNNKLLNVRFKLLKK